MSVNLARTRGRLVGATPAGLVRLTVPPPRRLGCSPTGAPWPRPSRLRRRPPPQQYKPALVADAAVRAVTEALTNAGLATGHEITAAYEDGRLVIAVAGADPGQVREAVAGFAFPVCSVP